MLHEDGPQQNTGHLGHIPGIRTMATTTTQRHNLDIRTYDLVCDTNTRHTESHGLHGLHATNAMENNRHRETTTHMWQLSPSP
jgi:hypothetical protein